MPPRSATTRSPACGQGAFVARFSSRIALSSRSLSSWILAILSLARPSQASGHPEASRSKCSSAAPVCSSLSSESASSKSRLPDSGRPGLRATKASIFAATEASPSSPSASFSSWIRDHASTASGPAVSSAGRMADGSMATTQSAVASPAQGFRIDRIHCFRRSLQVMGIMGRLLRRAWPRRCLPAPLVPRRRRRGKGVAGGAAAPGAAPGAGSQQR